MNVTDMNTDNAANDLTHLSSREQLSALMDSALPADQTRFLLRRLQHDDALAGCWERWRIAGETLRGMAPAQRLPADFASRVTAALSEAPPLAAQAARPLGTPAWIRWGVGGAMAASLAMVALLARQSLQALPAASVPASVAAIQVANPVPTPPAPMLDSSMPDSATPDSGTLGRGAQQTLAAATAVAAVARPLRESRRPGRRSDTGLLQAAGMDTTAAAALGVGSVEAVVPATELVSRPWPRSILPQYSSEAMTVGFGHAPRTLLADGNPFAGSPALVELPAPHAAFADAAAAAGPAGQVPADAAAARP
jgi:hypothetical protein